MQSLRLFLKLRGLRSGLRVSMENFENIEDAGIVPVYATHRLLEDKCNRLVSYFVRYGPLNGINRVDTGLFLG